MDEKDLDDALGLTPVKEESTKSLQCKNCGSVEFDMLSNQMLRCKHCGAVLDLDRKVVNNFITNNNVKSNPGKQGNSYHIVEKTLSENDFLREAYLDIIMDKHSPTDILTASFQPLVCENSQFMVVNAHYDCNYSCSVGFHRKEQYETYERVFDANLHTTVNKKVIKERTVTDWQPYNGNVSGDKITTVKLGGEDNETASDFLSRDIEAIGVSGKMREYDAQNDSSISIITPTDLDMKWAIRKGEDAIEEGIELPGDEQKDYNRTISHTINSINYYIIPEYSLKFKYEGEGYQISSLAYALKTNWTVPDVLKSVKKSISKKAQPYAISSLVLSLFTLIFSIFTFFVLHPAIMLWLNVVFIILTIALYVFYVKKEEAIDSKVKDDIFKEKLTNLQHFLSKEGLEPLTDNEIKRAEKMAKGWVY